MHRRSFVELTARSLALGALGGCVSRGGRAPAMVMTQRPLDAAAFHESRRYVETPFGSIAFLERGAGDVALFLHGFPLAGYQWRGAIDRLSAYRRCIAPDMMGLGYSKIPEGQSVAPDAQVEMIGALLDTLGVTAVDLIGNDSGGAVAQLFSVKYPERVRTMLLTNCDTEPDCPPQNFKPVIALAKAGKFADFSFLPVLADKSLARSTRGVGPIAFSNPSNPTDEAIEYYWAPLVASPLRKRQVEAFAIAYETNPLAGLEAKLKRSKVPTRIVWGTADRFFAPTSPDYLDEILPRSRGVRRIPEGKLYFPEEFPEVVAEEARKLWRV